MTELELKSDFINALMQDVIQRYKKGLMTGQPPTDVPNAYPLNKKSPIQNRRDYQYGMAVGIIRHASIAYFKAWYKRDSTPQENKEMRDVLERNIDELEDFYYKGDLR